MDVIVVPRYTGQRRRPDSSVNTSCQTRVHITGAVARGICGWEGYPKLKPNRHVFGNLAETPVVISDLGCARGLDFRIWGPE